LPPSHKDPKDFIIIFWCLGALVAKRKKFDYKKHNI
jgi:hypothetical protein